MFSLTISLPGSLSSFVKKINWFDLNHLLKLEAAVISHCLLTVVILVAKNQKKIIDLTEFKFIFNSNEENNINVIIFHASKGT